MMPAGLLVVLKLLTLVAATAQTVGFIGLFAFESLDPYKWPLLIGGTVAIVVSEGLSYLLAKRMQRHGELEGSDHAA
jgi:hypothetical protein